MKEFATWEWVAYILVLIGGINWGLIGLFKIDLISAILGGMLSRLVFLVVGVAAGYLIYMMLMKKKEQP